MMPRALTSRRSVITAIIGAGLRTCGRGSVPVACGVRALSMPGYRAVAALCEDIACPETIRIACLRTLPMADRSVYRLVQLTLADLPSNISSSAALRRFMRKRSRIDFRNGRTIFVDGWVLSATEMRLHALAALLSGPDRDTAGAVF